MESRIPLDLSIVAKHIEQRRSNWVDFGWRVHELTWREAAGYPQRIGPSAVQADSVGVRVAVADDDVVGAQFVVFGNHRGSERFVDVFSWADLELWDLRVPQAEDAIKMLAPDLPDIAALEGALDEIQEWLRGRAGTRTADSE